MPYTAKSFAAKHNKKLTGNAASTAARMATGMEAKGMDAGKAIRIANAKGDKMMGVAGKRAATPAKMSKPRRGW